MIDELRPDNTVTICLPLFLAGGQEERLFAKEYPTIAVDGCSKACAKRATEKYSGKISSGILVSDLIGSAAAERPALSTRDLTTAHRDMIEKVASEITKQFDHILEKHCQKNSAESPACCGGKCDC
jgi:uncharacterized metal-binding protein